MSELTPLEKAVIDKLLRANGEIFTALRAQAELAKVALRKMTGVGFFTTLSIPNNPRQIDGQSLQLRNVVAEISGLKHGAGFVLFVEDGVLDLLEGYTYGDEPWPKQITSFTLSYTDNSVT